MEFEHLANAKGTLLKCLRRVDKELQTLAAEVEKNNERDFISAISPLNVAAANGLLYVVDFLSAGYDCNDALLEASSGGPSQDCEKTDQERGLLVRLRASKSCSQWPSRRRG